jgi:hypothetical protein
LHAVDMRTTIVAMKRAVEPTMHRVVELFETEEDALEGIMDSIAANERVFAAKAERICNGIEFARGDIDLRQELHRLIMRAWDVHAIAFMPAVRQAAQARQAVPPGLEVRSRAARSIPAAIERMDETGHLVVELLDRAEEIALRLAPLAEVEREPQEA